VLGVVEDGNDESDPDGVVPTRLSLEDRLRAARDLAVTEHREHHRCVGRRDGRAQEPGERPAQVEERVSAESDQPRGGERAEDAQKRDRDSRSAEVTPPNLHAAVEEDDDQRDDADALDGSDRDVVGESWKEVRRKRGREEEDRGRGDGDAR